MTSIPDGVALAHHTSEETPAFMDAMCEGYADAYGIVPGEDIGVKTDAFRERATKGPAEVWHAGTACSTRHKL